MSDNSLFECPLIFNNGFTKKMKTVNCKSLNIFRIILGKLIFNPN